MWNYCYMSYPHPPPPHITISTRYPLTSLLHLTQANMWHKAFPSPVCFHHIINWALWDFGCLTGGKNNFERLLRLWWGFVIMFENVWVNTAVWDRNKIKTTKVIISCSLSSLWIFQWFQCVYTFESLFDITRVHVIIYQGNLYCSQHSLFNISETSPGGQNWGFCFVR